MCLLVSQISNGFSIAHQHCSTKYKVDECLSFAIKFAAFENCATQEEVLQTTKVKQTDVQRNWLLFDGTGKTVGRFASEIARLLQGKHKPEYVPYHDVGDHVVVVNCEHLKLTGDKWQQKIYYHHSGYVGGLKSISAAALAKKDPTDILRRAVRGMLPKNKLRAIRMNKLKLYTGSEHQHQAQSLISGEGLRLVKDNS